MVIPKALSRLLGFVSVLDLAHVLFCVLIELVECVLELKCYLKLSVWFYDLYCLINSEELLYSSERASFKHDLGKILSLGIKA